MKKEDIKYIVTAIIMAAIIFLVFKFIAWLLPYALVLLGLYVVYVLFIKIKNRSIELSKDGNKKKDNIKEAEIIKEKNEE